MTDEARKLAKRLCLFFREDASGSGILFALEDAMVAPIADALAAAREEGQRWIPVEERLPTYDPVEDGNGVLVWGSRGTDLELLWFSEGKFYAEDYDPTCYTIPTEPRFWQPLPSPPEAPR